MVNWITKFIGIKDASAPLKPEEFGCVVIDIRDILDGRNDAMTITKAFNKVFTVVATASKLGVQSIIQCEGGISRSPAFVVALFAFANNLEWEDAIAFVKMKVPQMQINQDLLDSFKEAFGQVQSA